MRGKAAAIVVGVLGVGLLTLAGIGCGSGKTATGTSAAPSPSPSHTSATKFVDMPMPAKPAKAVVDSYADSRALAAPLWAFGFDLLARQAAKTGGNVVVSPVSLSAALAMTLNGARGATATQMRQVLRFESLDPQATIQAWANLIADSNATRRAQVRIADSLWLRDGVPYIPAFLAANRDYFAADTRNLPADLTQAPAVINDWISGKTGGRIKDLISKVPDNTALVLVNTVYTKVAWSYFDKHWTEPQPFTLANGTKVQVPMMRGVLDARVADTTEYVAVPVQTNGELTFWVIVPKGTQTPESVVALLRDRGVGSLSTHAPSTSVDLRMPRFRIEFTSQNLPDDLAAMGMPDAFSPDTADFSGMADLSKLGVPIFIGNVLQKAMIDVKETGIEAAAASAVLMDVGGAPMVPRYTVRADRPFLVVLTGSNTNAPLFMALVRDPR
jgi:serine protease inhibitor